SRLASFPRELKLSIFSCAPDCLSLSSREPEFEKKSRFLTAQKLLPGSSGQVQPAGKSSG
ncbi:hypothetical protein, partial [Neglectibacter timonensis]|uniref:hypothetical protein n=1 Tax=Neglectibacter timonensis TaxID=1776382 RepID=UPI002109C846